MNAQIYGQVGTPGADEAQVLLTALRKFIAGVPLIPGLKALVARQTSEAAWTNMRPPNVALSADSAKLLFAAFDKSSRAPTHTA
jgi:4-hydroxy-tetrahydrodipicolinate synthase